jgi:hypothetical protein
VNEERPNYSAMTVNERLFVARRVGAFDAAVNAGDREKAIEILGEVDMSAEDAEWTVDTTLANPTKYGYPREQPGG